jgi:hypothetical protein
MSKAKGYDGSAAVSFDCSFFIASFIKMMSLSFYG